MADSLVLNDRAIPDTDSITDPAVIRDMERMAIGKLLIAKNHEDLLCELAPSHFSTVAHQNIYAAIMAMPEGKIDEVDLLRNLLEDQSTIRAVPNIGLYLNECSNYAATSGIGMYGWYAARIRAAAGYRQTRETIEKAARVLESGNIDAVRQVLEEGAVKLSAPILGSTTLEERMIEAVQRKIDQYAQDEYVRIVAREKAKDRRTRELAGELEVPDLLDFGAFLDQEDEAPQWRVDGLWPRQGNIILAAQYKAGKTTTVSNLLRSLADGDRFLGAFQVDPVTEGSIVLVDFEMPEIKLREWYRRQDVKKRDRIKIRAMRGHANAFDLVNPTVRARWVSMLAAADCKVWIVDCLGPILSALGRDEDNKGVGPVLDALTTTAAEAGVEELLLVHHMGHVAERSRGASRLRDWPDAEWRLLRKKDEDNPFGDASPDAPRFFTAFGRDVDVKEGQLHYDDATKRLTYSQGSRKETGALQALAAVLAYVERLPGRSGRDIEAAVVGSGIPQKACRDALKHATGKYLVRTEDGPRNSKLHTITESGHVRLAELSMAPADEHPYDDFGTQEETGR